MNKAELTVLIAEKANITRLDASKALDATIKSITETLANGETVTLVEFGVFTPKLRSARTGRNPKTGESVEIPESKSVRYKPTKAIKRMLNT